MKKCYLLLMIPLISSCFSLPTEPAKITIKNPEILKGIKIIETADSFNAPYGQYYVFAKVVNNSTRIYSPLELSIKCFNKDNKNVGEGLGGDELKPNDTTIITIQTIIPERVDRPVTVQLSIDSAESFSKTKRS